jgi:hypothetical protein
MDYPYIRAYGVRMGWTIEYTNDMLDVATNEKAPQTAVFRHLNSTWITIDELGEEERQKVEMALKRMLEDLTDLSKTFDIKITTD